MLDIVTVSAQPLTAGAGRYLGAAPRNWHSTGMNPVHPKKLLLTKWTAVQPVARQKHFVVTKVIEPEMVEGPMASSGVAPTAKTQRIEWIEMEAAYSGKVHRMAWRELRDTSLWRQGWV